jgi:hypothetical protein
VVRRDRTRSRPTRASSILRVNLMCVELSYFMYRSRHVNHSLTIPKRMSASRTLYYLSRLAIPPSFHQHPPLLIQESLLQDLHETRSLAFLLLGDGLNLGLFQLGLQLQLLFDPLGLFGGVRDGRVDQGSDGRREVGRFDPQGLGQGVNLGLDVGVAGDDFALASNSGFAGRLGLLLSKSKTIDQSLFVVRRRSFFDLAKRVLTVMEL